MDCKKNSDYTDSDSEMSHSSEHSAQSSLKCNTQTGIYSNETGSVDNYFQFYSKLANQQNMLQDYTRTSAYYNAINSNK